MSTVVKAVVVLLFFATIKPVYRGWKILFTKGFLHSKRTYEYLSA